MHRRTVLAGLGAIVAGSGAVLGSSAFDSVRADRTVSLETAGDADALLGLEPGPDGDAYVLENGTLEIDISETDGGGEGVNQNAVTAIYKLLEVTNNATHEVVVGFNDEYAIAEGDYDEPPGHRGYAVNDGAAAVLWASPDPGEPAGDNSPVLTTTGFGGSSTLVDDRYTYNYEDADERTISPGESLYIGILVDTRERTLEEGFPDQVDDTVTLYAERADP